MIKKTNIYRILKERDSEFIKTIDSIMPEVTNRLEVQVPKLFPEFTLHNIHHSIRVIGYIADIVSDLNSFNDFELTLMLLAALLHDLGMALGENEIKLIKEDRYFTDKSIKFEIFSKLYTKNAGQEIVRRYHADITTQIISDSKYSDFFILDEPHGVSYLEDIVLLCKSHTKDFFWMSESLSTHNIKGKYDYNLRYIAHLIRIADLLDIDQSRTPYELYKLINPKGVSDQEWRKHFIVTNTKKIEFNKKTRKKEIVFYGTSEDIKIHRKLMSYINWINIELKIFNNFCEQLDDEHFKNNVSNLVLNKIKTVGFTVSDYKLSLDFNSITELLMGENIYGDKKLGLREIIQNSIDACLVRKEIEKKNSSDYEPCIIIKINKENNNFIISDNGIGMSEEIIQNFFLNIGKSYYKSDIFKLNDLNYKPIGSFGIGFLSCFMLSEDVKIKTRYFKLPVKHTIQLEKGDEYIGFNSIDDVGFVGTEITLKYDQVLTVFDGDIKNVVGFINTFFVNDNYNLKIIINADIHEFHNTILKTKEKEKNVIIDDITKYLEDTKGFIELRNKHEFIRDVKDLKVNSDNLFYISNKEIIKNEVDLKNIVDTKNNKLVYMHLPLYDKNEIEEFTKALDILDHDIDATIDKVDCYDNAYIFFPCNAQNELEENEIFNETDPVIFDDILLSDVINRIDVNCFCPKIKIIEINILEDNEFKILEEFNVFNKYSWRWLNKNNKLYLRNILIKDYSYDKQIKVKTIDLLGFSLNIYKKSIVPDISRNDLLPESKKLVNNSINIALHLSALENFNLKEEEKNIIIKFIQKKLINNNHFVCDDILKKYNF